MLFIISDLIYFSINCCERLSVEVERELFFVRNFHSCSYENVNKSLFNELCEEK